MVILAALAGLVIGSLLVWAADRLPHLAGVPLPRAAAAPPASPVPVTWTWLTAQVRRTHLPALSPDRALRVGVEWASAVFFAGAWLRAGSTGETGLLVLAYAFFLLIALIDLKYRLVLNILTYPVAVAILLGALITGPPAPREVLLGGAFTFAIFFLTAWLRPGDLGGGDVKLAAVIGLAFGFPQVLWALLVGGGLGGLVAVGLLLRRHSPKQAIPYAPFLCFGAIAALLYNPFPSLV